MGWVRVSYRHTPAGYIQRGQFVKYFIVRKKTDNKSDSTQKIILTYTELIIMKIALKMHPE